MLNELFEKEPAYSDYYAYALEFCETPQPEQAAAEALDALPHKVSHIKSGSSLLAVLIKRGGLERTILLDGEPYAGTLEEFQNDEAVPDDAVAEYLVQTTPAGVEAAQTWRKATTLAALFATRPQYAPGFKCVLEQCQAEEGKTTQQLQEALIAAGALQPGLAGAQQLHASYFTSKLEQFGALVWDRKRWHTTQKGADAIAQGQAY